MLDRISLNDLYALYIDTLESCTSKRCDRSDEEVLYELFEEFDVGAHSFLHNDSLAKLRDNGFIDDEMVLSSKEVRRRWIELESRSSRTVAEVRSSGEWRKLFESCDQLLLKAKRPDPERHP